MNYDDADCWSFFLVRNFFFSCVSLTWLLLSVVQLSITPLNEIEFKDYYTRFIRCTVY
jgi:hypothetical protein